MTDLEHPQQRWTEWVTEACRAVDVDPARVDIVEIHHLSTFILGLALGASHDGASREDLLERILGTLPAAADPGPMT